MLSDKDIDSIWVMPPERALDILPALLTAASPADIWTATLRYRTDYADGIAARLEQRGMRQKAAYSVWFGASQRARSVIHSWAVFQALGCGFAARIGPETALYQRNMTHVSFCAILLPNRQDEWLLPARYCARPMRCRRRLRWPTN